VLPAKSGISRLRKKPAAAVRGYAGVFALVNKPRIRYEKK
jgi:hypothetical protein